MDRPFANMSGDPEQEYFADGMVEEIITALSRIRWLFVISDVRSRAYFFLKVYFKSPVAEPFSLPSERVGSGEAAAKHRCGGSGPATIDTLPR